VAGVGWGCGVVALVGVGDPLMCGFVGHAELGKDFMERTVVRCAEGHVFATASFPLQQLGADRLGPGRLLRCPKCARLRNAVPVSVAAEKR
jgi:hypothetical protein